VPHGLNVVIETTQGQVVIGRFDSTNGFQALLHDCDVQVFAQGEASEPFVQETATYGVDVKHRDFALDVASVRRVRLLKDVPKLAP
jgi:hypothetical protein